MSAEPLNETPPILLAVANTVADAELPEVSWLPASLTPGKLMFAVPSKDTPPIFLALDNAVVVAELPVVEPELPLMLPVTLPVRLPNTVVTFKILVKVPSVVS